MTQLLTPYEPSFVEPLPPIDAELFRTHFNRRPFKIAHHLADHPLLSLERLVELAQNLPERDVEYNAGDVSVSQDPSRTPRNGLSVVETVERIENCRSWMVLKHVEQHPHYKRLLDACLDSIRRLSESAWPGMRRREAFIFISSPGSVTPFHIDPENNFLLQVRGTKRVQLFSATDRFVLPESDIENFFAGAHRNLIYREEYRDRGDWYQLEPGEGLHFPVIAPHWVQNGPAVSVSLSITFRTDDSERRDALYRFNRTLRRWGLRPSPVGQDRRRDLWKLRLLAAGRSLRNLLRPAGRSTERRY
jgi:ribosomal protein L16 Arg81 hydroxylase